MVVSLFSFQLSRFYLLVELDNFICLEANHTHTAGSPAHNHHHDDAAAAPHSHDEDFKFQHCKDTFGGIALTPVQPLGTPERVSLQLPLGSRATLSVPQYPPIENDLAPPFQPPRVLS
ncbi:MAG: hypothetical protein HY647_03540 [Acidobacteria bacterium]|nr:hypothetical protein [Acidobacteriota bacterium]